MSLELVRYMNAETGVERYCDLPTEQAARLLEAGIGDRVPFLGREFIVMDQYDACLEVTDRRSSYVIDLGVADTAETRSHLQRVA